MPLRRKMWRSIGLVSAALSLLPILIRGEDSVTLSSGEVMRGRIVSESDKRVEMEVANADRTILSKRVISRSDVKAIQRETPEQAAERKTFESLARYKLDPNMAYPTNYYPAVIGAFEKFLTAYPKSTHAPAISAARADWEAEYPLAMRAAKDGLVKCRGQWMAPQQAQAINDEERRKKDAVRQQIAESQQRQAEQSAAAQKHAQETGQEQTSSSDATKKASSAARRGGSGYQVDMNSAIPY